MNCYRCQTPLPEGSRFCLSCGADVSGETGERTLPVDADPQLRAKLQADLGSEYILERELGRGGMAAVFLATEVNLGRKVAIKVLPPELTFGRGLIERFKREARTAATLDHPHIIPIHRVSASGNLFWYVMKYLEGGSLADLLQREGHLPLDRTTQILGQVVDALQYAHEHGVIHRDMKPANVLIDARGWVTVTDFGIAKAIGTESLTGSGSMIGTPYYMSPEQCAGTNVSSASDQYSLGIMTYQMVSGHLPFTGDTVIDIIKKHSMDPVPPLRVLRPTLPTSVVSVIERALAKRPEGRFSSVREFADALTKATVERPAAMAPRVKPLARARMLLQTLAPRAVGPAGRAGVVKTSDGRRWLVRGGQVLLILALAVVTFWPWVKGAWRGRVAEPVTPARVPLAAQVAESPNAPAHLVPQAESSTTVTPRHVTGRDVSSPRSSKATAPPQRAAGRSAARQPGQAPRVEQARPAPVVTGPSGAPALGPSAHISVGSLPLATISINGRRLAGNPVKDYEVPPGLVRLVFTVRDSSGTWSNEFPLTLGPDQRVDLGQVVLVRPN